MENEPNIVINTIKNWYDDDEFTQYARIEINAKINDKEINTYFIVQLCSGRYEPQNNCEIYSKNGNGDCDFDEDEEVIFDYIDIVDLAENAYYEYFKNNFEDMDANFNCSINNQSLCIRINKDSGKAYLILINDCHNSCNSYGSKEDYCGDFDSKDDALQHLEQFRTGEYQDCRGLNAFIKSLDE